MKRYRFLLCSLLLLSCNKKQDAYDTSGSFEAEETIVSAEASGVIEKLQAEEGEMLQAGEYIGYIDSTQAHLRRLQLQAQREAVKSRAPDVSAQLAAMRTQLAAAEHERQRIARLVNADAATRKQLDDATAQVNVLQGQISAQRSSLSITAKSLNAEARPITEQLAQVADQVEKYTLYAPIRGTILAKYASVGELATPGKPLYKIAALDTLWLRAYVSASQLPAIKLGSTVTVLIDNGPKAYKSYSGVLTWISDKSEFTPKSIQTKEERASTVYAIKIRVPNDGVLKIGMYAEVKFSKQ